MIGFLADRRRALNAVAIDRGLQIAWPALSRAAARHGRTRTNGGFEPGMHPCAGETDRRLTGTLVRLRGHYASRKRSRWACEGNRLMS